MFFFGCLVWSTVRDNLDETGKRVFLMPSEMRASCGFLCLNKPAGVTSRDVVNQVERWLRGPQPRGRRRSTLKVGHAGTLDPLATGVLVLAVGSTTRLIDVVQQQPKTYQAVIQLGGTSPTWDADGPITVTPDARPVDQSVLVECLNRQVGDIVQAPPPYSALRVAGQRAYDLARRGETVILAPRKVRIDQIAVLSYLWPKLELRIDCGCGTYIRSIAHELGVSLGCGAYIAQLERTRIGPFTIDQSIKLVESESTSPMVPTEPTIRSLARDREQLLAHIVPPAFALQGWPTYLLNQSEVGPILKGQTLLLTHPLLAPATIPIRPLSANDPTSTLVCEGEALVALLSQENELIALAHYNPQRHTLHPRKVFVAESEWYERHPT